MERTVYLDHAATTPIKPEVLEAMMPYLKTQYGNPSSIYALGRASRKAVEEARQDVAAALNARANEIFFTGSGTEADNWVLKGVAHANRNRGNHIITSSIEHHAVLNPCHQLEKEGFEVTYLPVNPDGRVDPQEVKNAIRPDTLLISIMTANNEVGTLQPIEEIGAIASERGVYFHTDAVQAMGCVHMDVRNMNIDLLSLSAHKIYGPKGVGALYIKSGVRIAPFMQGGAQERSVRAGTENVAGIAGLGAAIRLAVQNTETYNAKLLSLRQVIIHSIESRIPGARLNGHREKRLPGNINFSFPGVEGESLLLILDMKGIAVSSGSACTAGSLDPSHVLLAMGLPSQTARGSVRITLGEENTPSDVEYLLEVLPAVVERLRGMSPVQPHHEKEEVRE